MPMLCPRGRELGGLPRLSHAPRQVTDGEDFHGPSDRLLIRSRLPPPSVPPLRHRSFLSGSARANTSAFSPSPVTHRALARLRKFLKSRDLTIGNLSCFQRVTAGAPIALVAGQDVRSAARSSPAHARRAAPLGGDIPATASSFCRHPGRQLVRLLPDPTAARSFQERRKC